MISEFIQKLAGRTKINWTYGRAYRRALIKPAIWSNERILNTLLLAGIGLMVFLICQHAMWILRKEPLQAFIKPPQQLQVKPAHEKIMPKSGLTLNRQVSLFTLIKPSNISKETEAKDSGNRENAARKLEAPVINPRAWRIQIQSPHLVEDGALNNISNAHKYLQAGNVDLATQVFQSILLQDPHRVEALVGMWLVSKTLGHAQTQEEYLQRLRQEIPDYIHNDYVFKGSELE